MCLIPADAFNVGINSPLCRSPPLSIHFSKNSNENFATKKKDFEIVAIGSSAKGKNTTKSTVELMDCDY